MTAKSHLSIPQVAVLVESSHGASRNRLRGIFQYARLYGPWGLRMVTGGPNDQQLPDLNHWKGMGVIARAPDEKTFQSIIKSKMALVLIDPPDRFLKPNDQSEQFSCIVLNNPKIGRMAARFFLGNEFRHFAFLGRWSNDTWSQLRHQAFTDELLEHGYACRHLIPASHYGDPGWEKERTRIVKWLSSLPKPTGLFCASDLEGQLAIDACLSADINVPFEISVLGVGDDDLFCESCFPSMSSISIAWREGGFLAAKMLDRHMRDPAMPPETVFYDPKEVVIRSSTDSIFISDRLVIKAVDYIRQKNGFGLRVTDVAKQMKVSRQWIERRFKNCLGISVIDFIKQTRMKHIRSLVIESDMQFIEIARISGFENPNYMRILFKEQFGVSMSEYRKNYHLYNPNQEENETEEEASDE